MVPLRNIVQVQTTSLLLGEPRPWPVCAAGVVFIRWERCRRLFSMAGRSHRYSGKVFRETGPFGSLLCVQSRNWGAAISAGLGSTLQFLPRMSTGSCLLLGDRLAALHKSVQLAGGHGMLAPPTVRNDCADWVLFPFMVLKNCWRQRGRHPRARQHHSIKRERELCQAWLLDFLSSLPLPFSYEGNLRTWTRYRGIGTTNQGSDRRVHWNLVRKTTSLQASHDNTMSFSSEVPDVRDSTQQQVAHLQYTARRTDTFSLSRRRQPCCIEEIRPFYFSYLYVTRQIQVRYSKI